jgi:aspartyl-tRNA(Asn)/glutamyl-tRNA(Gln) amidotransferase subunit B
MNWEVVIGLETHAQLSTRSKIFSGAATAFGASPNSQASAVDIALPGVLPVLNRGAVERAIRLGLAVGGIINRRSLFARKNYFYPDLPKGYQISQYELPIVEGGEIPIVSPTRGEINVRLTRAHLEEDAGKSLHEDFHGMTGIDLNRAGTPLLEIVSEPDMHSAEEAVAYARALHGLVRWIGICDGNMQEGSFRCDANVSVRRPGAPLGTRREIKNLNSFRFLQQAIDYDIHWQIQTLEEGGRIEQATILFDPDTGQTRVMRSKEDAHDYRYFPDPDLLPLIVSEQWITEIATSLGAVGTPPMRRKEYIDDYRLASNDAWQLVKSRETAEYFDQMVARLGKNEAKLCANWMNGELAGALNRDGLDITQSPVSSGPLSELLARLIDGTLSGKMAKEVFDAMWAGEGEAEAIIAAKGLKQISDSGEIGKVVAQVLVANPQQVADYRGGKEKAFNSLVGQVMKATQGKANPAQVTALLKEKLAEG